MKAKINHISLIFTPAYCKRVTLSKYQTLENISWMTEQFANFEYSLHVIIVQID